MNNPNNLLRVTAENRFDWWCWSADVESRAELFGVLDQLPSGLWVKIDRAGEMEMNQKMIDDGEFEVSILDLVVEAGFKLFADAKITEIPTKVAKLARLYVKHRPAMLNIMSDSWSNGKFVLEASMRQDELDALKQFYDICMEAGVIPCAVTELTTTTDAVIAAKHGGRTRDQQTLAYTEILYEIGYRNMVCAVNQIAAIMANFPDMCCWPAGIRPAGSETHDQVNAKTPEHALSVGAFRLVTGRPITEGGDIVGNFNTLADDLVVKADAARAA